MPYDPTKTRNLLTITGAFANQPGGEYIQQLADQLKEAESEIVTANADKRKAEQEANRFSAELETAQQNVRRLREGNSGVTEMVKTLEAIARNPKGSQAVAKETLAKINGTATPV